MFDDSFPTVPLLLYIILLLNIFYILLKNFFNTQRGFSGNIDFWSQSVDGRTPARMLSQEWHWLA